MSTSNTIPETPPPNLVQRSEKRQGRDTVWVFIEMLCAFLTVAGVNMKLAEGRAKWERLAHQNDTFKYQVETEWDDQQWVSQHVKTEDTKTPA